jgi:hypothetical protein
VVVEPAVESEILGPNHEPQPSAAIVVVQELPWTLKDKKRKFLPFVSPLPRTRTRSERSTVIAATTSTSTASTLIPSPMAPTTNQNPPNVTISIYWFCQ